MAYCLVWISRGFAGCVLSCMSHTAVTSCTLLYSSHMLHLLLDIDLCSMLWLQPTLHACWHLSFQGHTHCRVPKSLFKRRTLGPAAGLASWDSEAQVGVLIKLQLLLIIWHPPLQV